MLRFSKLTNLKFEFNSIGDGDVKLLIGMLQSSNLTYLYLRNNNISNEGFKLLDELINMNK